jgi:hypothetical protein
MIAIVRHPCRQFPADGDKERAPRVGRGWARDSAGLVMGDGRWAMGWWGGRGEGEGAVADTPGLIALHRFPRPLLGPCDLKPRVSQAPGAGEATKGVRQDAMSEEGGRPRILPPPPSLPMKVPVRKAIPRWLTYIVASELRSRSREKGEPRCAFTHLHGQIRRYAYAWMNVGVG